MINISGVSSLLNYNKSFVKSIDSGNRLPTFHVQAKTLAFLMVQYLFIDVDKNKSKGAYCPLQLSNNDSIT